jgi:hypothetical protein
MFVKRFSKCGVLSWLPSKRAKSRVAICNPIVIHIRLATDPVKQDFATAKCVDRDPDRREDYWRKWMQETRTDNLPGIVEGIHRYDSQRLSIKVGGHTLIARFEETQAPLTCALFRKMLPLRSSLVHCRWSGESTWVPFEPPSTPISFENHTSHPVPGQILIYAQQFSEPEILIPYGACCFSSKVGQLAGNHFLTLVAGAEHLPELGRSALWDGAKQIVFELTG